MSKAKKKTAPKTKTSTAQRGPLLLDKACDVSAFAAKMDKDQIVPNVGNGVTIDVPNRRVLATNGHFIAIVPFPAERVGIPFATEPRGSAIEGVRTIGADQARDMCANIPTLKKPALFAFDRAAMTVDDGAIVGTTNDNRTAKEVATKPIIGEFPPVDKVVLKGESVAHVTLSAAYIKAIGAYFEKHCGLIGGVRIDVYGEDKQVRFRGAVGVDEDRRADVWCMPMQERD